MKPLNYINSNASSGIPKVGVGERCYIKNAIIDKNCRIGNDVKIIGGNGIADAEHELVHYKR